MTVKDLYEFIDKSEEGVNSYSIHIYFDSNVVGNSNNVLAFCDTWRDVSGNGSKGADSFFDYPYSVEDLFDLPVVKFRPSGNGLWIEVEVFDGMKIKNVLGERGVYSVYRK